LSLGTSIALAGLPLYMLPDQKLLNDFFSDPFITAAIFIALLLCWFLADRFLMSKKTTQPASP